MIDCQGPFEKMIPEEKKREVSEGTSQVCAWHKIIPRKGNLLCRHTEVGVCSVSSWNSKNTSMVRQLD